MTIVIPPFNDALYPRKREALIQDVLRKPTLEILAKHGPLNATAVCYFMKRIYDIEIITHAMGETLRTLASVGDLQGRVSKESGHVELYQVSGDTRTPELPNVFDYRDAFIDMYYRYQAIRQNPELATAPEYLIDEIYNQKGEQT